MSRRTLVYVISDIDKSLHFEWIASFLKLHFELTFVLIGNPDSALARFLREEKVPVICLRYTRKSELPVVWWRVLRLLLRLRPDIIHTHLWIANILGLTAAYVAGIKKRIYTRHHATIHYRKHRSGLKWDRLNNRLATHVVAISRNIENILVNCDRAKGGKVRLIYHGFDFEYFHQVLPSQVDLLYEKFGIMERDRPIVGVISRWTDWKGLQYVIPAFQKLLTSFPHAHLILANAHGDYESVIMPMLSELPARAYTRVRFEPDLAGLYRTFDVFVHVPVDAECEAFGQTYIEPLIVGIPSIFTLSGIAREFVKHERNALVVDFQNSEQIYQSMLRILQNSDLATTLGENGKKSISDFSIERHLEQLKGLYLE